MRFDSYHPMINLIYFAGTIASAAVFDHPVFVMIAYVSAFAYSVKLRGVRGLVLDLCLIPLMAGYTWLYSYYNHFGVTMLRENIIGNHITLEAVVYGMQISVSAAAVIMMVSCLFEIFSTDKVVYLFGCISPRLSLFLSVALRSLPRLARQAGRVDKAQAGIGRGCRQGAVWKRAANGIRMVSVLITWFMESIVESAQSMKSRGYSLKGRTAFSIYRFDNRDRSYVVFTFLCITMTVMAVMLDQTHIYYDPQIIMNRITPVSYAFYMAYAAFMLSPLFLQICGEWRFRRQRTSGSDEETHAADFPISMPY